MSAPGTRLPDSGGEGCQAQDVRRTDSRLLILRSCLFRGRCPAPPCFFSTRRPCPCPSKTGCSVLDTPSSALGLDLSALGETSSGLDRKFSALGETSGELDLKSSALE